MQFSCASAKRCLGSRIRVDHCRSCASAPSNSDSKAFRTCFPSSAGRITVVKGSRNLTTALCLLGLLYLSLLLCLCGSQVSPQAQWERACKFSFTGAELTDVADCIFKKVRVFPLSSRSEQIISTRRNLLILRLKRRGHCHKICELVWCNNLREAAEGSWRELLSVSSCPFRRDKCSVY